MPQLGQVGLSPDLKLPLFICTLISLIVVMNLVFTWTSKDYGITDKNLIDNPEMRELNSDSNRY